MAENEKLNYFVGLDIGTTAVRCVIGELAGEATMPTIIGFSSSPNSGMRKGNVAYVDEVADAITNAISEAERIGGQPIKRATVNVNGSHVQGINSKGVIAISSPNRVITDDDRVRVEEAATIVQLPPNKDIIQVFSKNYRLDGQENIKDPVGMQGVRLEVDTHIVMASTPSLKSLDQAVDKAGLVMSHRTVSGLAAAEVLLERQQRDSGVAVLDIGAATTNMVVIEDGEVEHIAVLPMGGTHITNDLAIGLKCDLDVAEIVKLKHASLSKAGRGDASFVHKGETIHIDKEMMRIIIEARVEELLEYADKELKRIHRSRKLPGGVVFTGGSSKLPGLADFAKDTIQLPARVGAWPHIPKIVDGLDEQIFAPAVGLMLLDMLLGPAEKHHFGSSEPGILSSVSGSLGGLFSRVKHR